MDLYEVFDQVVNLLQSRGRASYRALQRQFGLDDDYLADLKVELIEVQQVAVDQDGKMLVWIGKVASPPTEPQTPEAERRQLTVMFCDLVESTALAARLDPEDYREVMRAYQQTCAAVIQRFDATIGQYLGDGLLVYFGYPEAHEDDTQRAVRAGLGIIDAIGLLHARLERDKDIRLAVRVGIHTGLVVVGKIGAGVRQEQLALGDTPNIAARLQGLAAPDTVVVSPVTYGLVHGFFTCQTLGAQTLKGLPQPLTVYRVLQESGAQSRLAVAAMRGLTPLVGREQEVGLLLGRWAQAKDGMGQVVLLSGEAGIGKSRLAQALEERVGSDGYTRIEFRCSPYYTNNALYPVIEHIERLLRWHRDDGPEAKLDKLEQVLRAYRLPLTEVMPLLAALLSLPHPTRYAPLSVSPQRQRQQTQEALVAWLLVEAERQPVLAVWEDLHWADPSSLEFLGLLIDQAPTARLLTLLTYRLEFRPPWAPRSHVTQLTLTRFTRPQVEAMVERLTGGKALPPEVLQQIVAKTDGVPLFVEELSKAVLESGVLKEADDHYELTAPLPALAIPTTLQDSLMARLDRLVTAKGMAQLGATIGRHFPYDLLHAVAHLDDATLQRELGRLVEAELLYKRGVAPQTTYIFKHALIQEAAYQSLLKRTRQHYHRQIAQMMEERFPESAEAQPELLAHHYTKAGLSMPAMLYWQRAGERAVRRSANLEAISHLTKGLEVLRTLPDTPERSLQELTLQRILGVPLLATKDFAAAEVEHVYARARALCQQVGDTSQIFPVLFGLWGFYEVRGDLQTARELAEQLLALAEREQDPALLLQGHRALGDTLVWLGQFVLARTHLEQGIALYNPQQHRAHAALYGQDPDMGCRSYVARALWMLGYPDQALQKSYEALSLAQELGHPFSLAFALTFVAVLHRFRREVRAAQEQAGALITLASEQGFPFWLAAGTGLEGWVMAAQGRGMEGIAKIHQSMAALQATGAKLARPWHHALLAEAYMNEGQAKQGLNLLTEALATVHETGERFFEAELYRLKGELVLAHSAEDRLEAESCFHQAIAVARHQQAKSLELRAAMSLSRLWQRQGKQTEARKLLAEIYGWFTEGFDTADLQEARALLEELS
jgi:predicted ATPase/class 3 adenylate cyclase